MVQQLNLTLTLRVSYPLDFTRITKGVEVIVKGVARKADVLKHSKT